MAQRQPAAPRYGQGFTLVELLIILAVLGLLLAILAPSFVHSSSLGKRTVCAANLRNMSVSYASLRGSGKLRQDLLSGTVGASWAGFIFPDLSYHSKVLICPEADAANDAAPPRFTKRNWGNIEWDFFNMDNSMPPFSGMTPPWNMAKYSDFYAAGSVPTMWKLNEEDYQTFIKNTDSGWGVMGNNKDYLPKYTPGPSADRYWIVFEDQGGLWTSANGGGHDYRDYAVHVEELGPATYNISFAEFGSSDANHGVMTDGGMDLWIAEGSGDHGIDGPYYFSEPPTNYGMNTSVMQQGLRQVLFLDYEILLCDPLAEPDSDEAFDRNISPRHIGKVNVAFADGSVQTMSLDKLTPRRTENFDAFWDLAP